MHRYIYYSIRSPAAQKSDKIPPTSNAPVLTFSPGLNVKTGALDIWGNLIRFLSGGYETSMGLYHGKTCKVVMTWIRYGIRGIPTQ